MTFTAAVFVALWAGFTIGLLVGLRLATWADQRGKHQAGWTLTTLEPTVPPGGEARVAYVFCPRCGRLDGTHSSACDRWDRAEARKFSARGQDGSSQTPPVRRSDGRG